MNGIIGKKLGMTSVFDEKGAQVAVTVIQAGPCVVVQRKASAGEGYEAVQLGFEDQKEQRVAKPAKGHFKKAGVAPQRVLCEIRLGEGEDAKVGDKVTAAIFDGVTHVDVIGTTKGRGFAGVVRRHGFGGGWAAHGSMMHRRSGAVGNRTWPARVFKNKRMAGHMGNARATTQNLKVVQVRPDESVILVEGAVPGPTGGILIVQKATKKTPKAAGKS